MTAYVSISADSHGSKLRPVVSLSLVLCLAVVGCSDSNSGESPVQVAAAYWEGIENADLDATLATVDPNVRDRDIVAPVSRAGSIADSLAWYEAVDWSWTYGSCDQTTDVAVTCTATARNAWSDALGVEPVTGTFKLRVIDGQIISVEEEDQSFISQWGPQVFFVFAQWVEANHPDDALIMFSDNPVDDQILELYRRNTERFVAAQAAE